MAGMVSGVGSQGARPALRWSVAMSGFVLRRFVDLIGTGVRTDKGFKEIHLNSVAKNVSEFCGQEVTGQQVYNHLRKWRSREEEEAVSDVAAAVRESIHAEAAPGIYNAVINYPGFSREALMYALNHMMEHKATSPVFLDMTPDDRDLWLKTFLAKHYHN
ncbi:10A19I.15 [Zea mays]|uniref:10A19I.15 n=1 Tax=Zea mays TaxID=4577 RepID=A0A1D6HGJ4_MAIZE|nr:10A19I.15 [Zea mays]